MISCHKIVVTSMFVMFVFFKQKTAYEMRISDWSSDVCSSDLHGFGRGDPMVVVLDNQGLGRRGADSVDRCGVDLRVRLRLGDILVGQRELEEIGRASRRERVCQYV